MNLTCAETAKPESSFGRHRKIQVCVIRYLFEQRKRSFPDGEAAVKFSEPKTKKLKIPIVRLQNLKPAPSADEVSCSNLVPEDTVPLQTSAVA